MSDTPPRPAIAALRALAFTAAAAVTAGCGGSSDGDGGNDPSASAELNDLASFPAPAPDHDRATGPATVTQGEDAVCTRTPYSLSSAPRDVVMFNADPQVLWPGALIVGHSYRDGALELLPIAERAPVRLSIQGLYADQTAVTVPAPTGSAVTAAVNRLLAQAVRDHTVPTNSIEYTQTSAYNLDQAALKVGLSARYLGARARASLNVSTSSSESSVVAHALVRMFTVAVDAPATPDGFFHGLTAESLAAQEALGRIGEGNAPVYVASVTYGQIMMFSATASASASEIKAALSASFNGFAGGGSGSLSAAHKELLGSASIDVVTLGGSGGAVRGMILSGTPADFFVGTDLITSAVPIAYTLKDLSGRVAKVAETSEYTLETCTENGLADLYVVNAGGGLGGGTVTGYYPNGARAPLNVAIAGLTAPQGIAYDALDDALFVLDFAGGTRPRLRAFAPDGSPAQVVTAASPFPGLSSPSGVTYDTRLGRLYVVDVADGSGLGIVRAYTPRGEALNLFFSTPTPAFASHAIAHDPQRRRIYVTRSTRSEGGGFVTVFEDDGTDVTPAGSFPGLRLPEGVAIDPATGRVYVSDYFAGTVLAFDPDGTPIPLAHPISGLRLPRGLAYDPETGQLYVAVEGASTIEVFRPDGTPVASLATPAFPDVSSPEGIVLR